MGKAVVLVVSAVVLVACVATVGVVTVSNRQVADSSKPEMAELSTSQKNIQQFCQPTDNQHTCETTLSSVAGNNTEPKDLVGLVFNITIDHIKQAFDHSSTIKEAAKDPRTSEALENCRELLDYAIDDLRTSVDRLDDFSMEKIDKFIDDLKVWISASITYQETCLDGFEDANTDAAASMRKALNSSAQLTSNVLAIVTSFGDTLDKFELGNLNRKLLAVDAESFPSWVSSGKRRLLQKSPAELKPDVTVAQDGSGDVKTIAEALLKIPQNSAKIVVIYIKEGVYNEKVEIGRSYTNLMMVGDGPTKTKITGSLNFIDGVGTFKTATVAVVGDGFIAKDLWIENSAGAAKHQAVALRVQSDKSVFYNVRLDGYQDTLYVHTKRQFYRECTITGTIDFIFGDSASVFQNCLILARKPLDNQQNIVTAQGRKDRRSTGGIILHNCTISADPEYYPFRNKLPTFLGRPWKEYSRTFVMQSQLDDLINPKGWLPWLGDFGLNTCFYTEIDNRGPGADKSQRVTWRGVKNVDLSHAQKFTVQRFIQGNTWLPQTGVPFTLGLLPPSGSTN
ncbi:putative pectinesterase/pectinesterase inhibitor 28 [Curcuma longa]|uniref:putative pectinesterase/pectinesterase inhibitor 28 n=1 Tax=Curcuma longa TaxID=136217 RepID=UPI003D9EA995